MSNTSRRGFLKNLAIFGGAAALSKRGFAIDDDTRLTPQKMVINSEFKGGFADKNPIRIGFIGCNNRGRVNIESFLNAGQKAAAFCDVDSSDRLKAVVGLFAKNPNIYKDYRLMLEKEHKNIDAVCISTPDVSHFAAAMCALSYGLPVYVEKPLCHSIGQLRALRKLALEKGATTQMGNQSHSKDGIQICKEWIGGGLIGKVREVSIWTDRPIVGMRCYGLEEWPAPEPAPQTLDWDLWQNVAETAPYRPLIAPGAWRSWWKYGSGSLGDIGCHMLDIPYYALGLKYPSKVATRQNNKSQICTAMQDAVDYYFEESAQGVPVKISWHSGVVAPSKRPAGYDLNFMPKLPKEYLDTGRTHDHLPDNGQFFIGDEGAIFVPTMHLGGAPVLLPKSKWLEVKNNLPPPQTRYEGGNHYLNFARAVRREEKSSSDFEYGGRLTELVQLGNLSLRTRSQIIWDFESVSCRDNTAANAIVNEPMRKGWY